MRSFSCQASYRYKLTAVHTCSAGSIHSANDATWFVADDSLLLHVTTGLPQRHLWQEGKSFCHAAGSA